MSHWAKEAKSTIERVVAENPGKTDDELLELIDAAYPFGPREHWPYKVWLTERRAWRISRVPIDSPLAIICNACGADIGKRCREIVDPADVQEAGYWPKLEIDTFHETRLVRFRVATSGPLFGEP